MIPEIRVGGDDGELRRRNGIEGSFRAVGLDEGDARGTAAETAALKTRFGEIIERGEDLGEKVHGTADEADTDGKGTSGREGFRIGKIEEDIGPGNVIEGFVMLLRIIMAGFEDDGIGAAFGKEAAGALEVSRDAGDFPEVKAETASEEIAEEDAGGRGREGFDANAGVEPFQPGYCDRINNGHGQEPPFHF